jgi:hypothetical protein
MLPVRLDDGGVSTLATSGDDRIFELVFVTTLSGDSFNAALMSPLLGTAAEATAAAGAGAGAGGGAAVAAAAAAAAAATAAADCSLCFFCTTKSSTFT